MKMFSKRRKVLRDIAALAVVSIWMVRSIMMAAKSSARFLHLYNGEKSFLLPGQQQQQQSSHHHHPVIIREMPSCKLNITEAPIWETKKHQGDKWQTFSAVVGVLDSMQVDYFLDYGTLLGFVRECRNFDKDFDFSISIEWLRSDDNLAQLKEAFEASGFEIVPEGKKHEIVNERMTIDGNFMFQLSKDRHHMDFFFTTRSPGQVENGVYYWGFNSCPRQLSGIETFQWNDLNVRIPVPYDDFLRASYGDDYMRPQKITFFDLAEETLQSGRCLMANDRPFRVRSSGILVCLTDAQSITEALVLAKSLGQWGPGGQIQLEVYHSNLVSKALTDEFLRYDKVRVINLAGDTKGGNMDPKENLYTQALRATKLKQVLVTRPSTIFLQNPVNIFETMKYQYSSHRNAIKYNCGKGAPCVKTTDISLTKSLGSLDFPTVIGTYPRKSTPTVSLKEGESKLQAVSVHETGHRVGAFAFPTREYLEWQSHNVYSESSFTFRTESGELMDMPLAYRRHLRDHWELYEASERQAKELLSSETA